MLHRLKQRGPTTSTEQFRTSLVDYKQQQLFFLKNAMILGRKYELCRSIPIEDLFFFFREHPDFGTKIGVFSRLSPANSNNFKKWPTRVHKLDHPGLKA